MWWLRSIWSWTGWSCWCWLLTVCWTVLEWDVGWVCCVDVLGWLDGCIACGRSNLLISALVGYSTWALNLLIFLFDTISRTWVRNHNFLFHITNRSIIIRATIKMNRSFWVHIRVITWSITSWFVTRTIGWSNSILSIGHIGICRYYSRAGQPSSSINCINVTGDSSIICRVFKSPWSAWLKYGYLAAPVLEE